MRTIDSSYIPVRPATGGTGPRKATLNPINRGDAASASLERHRSAHDAATFLTD
jgi:hypothetical protein